jgi:hypothetical protein
MQHEIHTAYLLLYGASLFALPHFAGSLLGSPLLAVRAAGAAAAQEEVHRSAGYQPNHGLYVLAIHACSFLPAPKILHHWEQVFEHL